MFFVGHTRFSVFQPSSRAWAVSRDDPGAYLAHIYSEERMRPRLEIFIGHTLRLLDMAAQGHQMRHIVSYSREMPAPYRDELVRAATNYPWIVLDEHVKGVGSKNMNREALDLMGRQPGVYGTYRVDDDDLLPVDYFDRMAALMSPATVGMYASLGRGVTAIYEDGAWRNPRIARHRLYSAGLLAVCKSTGPRYETPAPASAHNRADEAAPAIVDSRRLGYLWTRTLTQDTARVRGQSDLGDLDRELARLRPADTTAVREAFPGVF